MFGMRSGEDLTPCVLENPFGPLSAEITEAIQLHDVPEPFEARVGRESHDVKTLDGGEPRALCNVLLTMDCSIQQRGRHQIGAFRFE